MLKNETMLRFTRHALERLFQRQISPGECEAVFKNGEAIENYPHDKPFPSKLYFGMVKQRKLHIVVAIERSTAHLITAYEPDSEVWENDFKTRRKK